MKKKDVFWRYSVLLAAILVVVTVCAMPALAESRWEDMPATAGTDYTWEGTTLLVHTAKGLAFAARESVNGESFAGKTIRLTTDIDLSGCYWQPLGADTPFAGTMDGNFHTVSGMECICAADYAGFVGRLSAEGVLQNITVEGTVSNGPGNLYTGGLVGKNCGKIRGSAFRGSVTSRSTYAGALAGSNDGLVENCAAIGRVEGRAIVGGAVGANQWDGRLQNCYAAVTVSTTGLSGAAAFCYNYYGSVQNVYWLQNSTNNRELSGVVETLPVALNAGSFSAADAPVLDESGQPLYDTLLQALQAADRETAWHSDADGLPLPGQANQVTITTVTARTPHTPGTAGKAPVGALLGLALAALTADGALARRRKLFATARKNIPAI